MTRIPLATPLKTRTGDTSKDARLKNAYVEVRGDQSVVRKRPCARGGVEVGTGAAQGGIGLNIGGVDYIYTVNGDTGALDTLATAGTTWDSGTSYSIGDHVSVDFVDYWALTDNSNSDPSNNPSDWNASYVPDVPLSVLGVGTKLGIANIYTDIGLGSFISLGTLGGAFSTAYDCSLNNVVVGESYVISGAVHAFRWTESGGMVDLGLISGATNAIAYSCSADGAVVAGIATVNVLGSINRRIFIWTQAGGMIDLGDLGAALDDDSLIVTDCSDDGDIIIGSGANSSAYIQAFKWDSIGGLAELGTLSGGTSATADARSSDGSIIFGTANNNLGTFYAYRWTQAGGMVSLGFVVHSIIGCSSDGLTVIGQYYLGLVLRAFIWTQAGGMIDLGDLGVVYCCSRDCSKLGISSGIADGYYESGVPIDIGMPIVAFGE